MFRQILGWLLGSDPESKRKSKQSKRQSKRPNSKNARHKGRGASFVTHTTPEEREAKFALRRQGLSVNAIATEMGRSSRTVYEVLTDRRSQSLPAPLSVGGESNRGGAEDSPPRRGRRRVHSDERRAETGEGLRASLLKRIEPILVEAVSDRLKHDHALAVELVAGLCGVSIPQKSLDDFALEEIKNDPELRRQWAESYLERMKRNGRTEMDIAREALDMVLEVGGRLAEGRWSNVAKEAITSGELRRTIVESVSAFGSLDHSEATQTSERQRGAATPYPTGQQAQNVLRPKLSKEARDRILSELPPAPQVGSTSRSPDGPQKPNEDNSK